MNKQSLYTVGGAALLATTALATTTDAQAAAGIKTAPGLAALPSTFVPAPLATQIFPTTTTTANNISLGGTSTFSILIDVSPTFASFDVKLDIDTTTASFNNTIVPTVTFYAASSTGTLEVLLSSVTGCAVQPSAERISILACNPTGAAVAANGSKVDAIVISGLAFTSASALRTPGTSITLSGSTFLANTSSTIDGITPTAIITSKSVVSDLRVVAGSTATIDNNSSTAFALFVSSGATTSVSATLGCVNYSTAAAVGTDLSNVFSGLVSIISTAEVKVTHSALTDSSLLNITFGGTTRVASQFSSNTVTFQVAGLSLTGTAIVASFNGTSAISASSGTLSATVTPTAAGSLAQAVSQFSGTLASLTRGGLSVELNSVLPSAMKASYISFLRIANQSSVAGTAVITVKNDGTGAAVGSFTTASIPSGATLSVNSVDIDAGLTAAGATVLTNASYKVTVTGAFNGYVQNLLFNVANSSFADASGFRNGALTGDP